MKFVGAWEEAPIPEDPAEFSPRVPPPEPGGSAAAAPQRAGSCRRGEPAAAGAGRRRPAPGWRRARGRRALGGGVGPPEWPWQASAEPRRDSAGKRETVPEGSETSVRDSDERSSPGYPEVNWVAPRTPERSCFGCRASPPTLLDRFPFAPVTALPGHHGSGPALRRC